MNIWIFMGQGRTHSTGECKIRKSSGSSGCKAENSKNTSNSLNRSCPHNVQSLVPTCCWWWCRREGWGLDGGTWRRAGGRWSASAPSALREHTSSAPWPPAPAPPQGTLRSGRCQTGWSLQSARLLTDHLLPTQQGKQDTTHLVSTIVPEYYNKLPAATKVRNKYSISLTNSSVVSHFGWNRLLNVKSVRMDTKQFKIILLNSSLICTSYRSYCMYCWQSIENRKPQNTVEVKKFKHANRYICTDLLHRALGPRLKDFRFLKVQKQVHVTGVYPKCVDGRAKRQNLTIWGRKQQVRLHWKQHYF